MTPISERFQKDINKNYKPIESAAEEMEYIKRAKSGDKRAADTLVFSQLKTVLAIAGYYKNSKFDMDDLMTIGTMGIYTAIEKFEFDRKCRFITYATPWIKAEIAAAVHDNDTIRLPANVIQQIKKQEKAILSGELQESDAEILKYVVKSFGEPSFAENASDHTMEDTLGIRDEDLSQVENMVGVDKILITIDDIYAEKGEDGEIIEPSRERVIYEMLFGINGNDEHTLDEVGQKFGLTRERIRQIKEKVSRDIQKRLKITV